MSEGKARAGAPAGRATRAAATKDAGSETKHAHTALLIVDMINLLDFPEGRQLLAQALPAARRIAALKRRLKAAGIPTIYVNDNFTHWHSDFRQIVAMCSAPSSLGAPLAAELVPDDDDYTVLKPRHSAFFATPLAVLLEQLEVRRTIVTGVAGDACVLASASDAHVRGLEVIVPADCVASITAERNRNALALMKSSMRLDIRSSRSIRPD
ncbi:MAG TPA: isochorismatase family cysteine hydrolase [Burkholderiaceae bacterium]|nr:isochorismatase family cysteine hydrolase [Burkholderiaceae bacterium]